MKPENFVMSEIFTHMNGLAVHVNHTAIHENANDGVTPFDAIDHAVSQHDALTETLRLKEEECKQLAQDKVEIMEILKVLANHNCPSEYYSESELDAFFRASKLIEAHKLN